MSRFFITGRRNAGKSYIIEKIIESFDSYGFLTRFSKDNNTLLLKLIGYGNSESENFTIAKRNANGKMYPLKDGFEKATLMLKKIEPGGKLLVIDELGFLELCCEDFRNEVVRLLKGANKFVCVIRKEGNCFLNSLKKMEGTSLIMVDENNRRRVLELLLKEIKKPGSKPGF
ncbi:nucleoside-triphosphatase [Kosmotoga pacifica]|uniref:AAA+ ATPase domain-containing protein n=1 Tax=Kosmotoga pacifica TaxID=1330330 RepID=A0A0G2Z6Q0_9BACT|nr:nucleoside-triphosphatase [Kosmotoga pacifica]AKI97285.1 hypothetical protein IX53_05045 [Kosmotoga pacifica]